MRLGPFQPRLISYSVHEHGSQKRSFQAMWFDLPHAKEWLEYSTRVNAMYCFACRMFGMPGTSEENWISKGVKGTNWKNALKRIRDHSVSRYHSQSTLAMKVFFQNDPIDCQLDHQRAKGVNMRQREIDRNREMLLRILDIIKFLAKQNILFQGHNESNKSSHRGNFIELVHLQARYDAVLQHHLQTAARNSTYLSADIQNQLIKALGDEVLTEITEQVREAKLFSLLVDETSDVSQLEQVSFVL